MMIPAALFGAFAAGGKEDPFCHLASEARERGEVIYRSPRQENRNILKKGSDRWPSERQWRHAWV